jgi:hypothetical protein
VVTPDRDLEARLEAAGLSLRDVQLPVAVPDPSQLRYRVPHSASVVTDADGAQWIEWRSNHFRDWRPRPLSPVPGKCLAEFVRLATASEARIAAFATSWGVLGEPYGGGPVESKLGQLGSGHDQISVTQERLADWKLTASRVAALLGVASNLQQDRAADHLEWELMIDALSPLHRYGLQWGLGRTEASSLGEYLRDEAAGEGIYGSVGPNSPITAQRQIVMYCLERWFEYGNVTVKPLWGLGNAAFSVVVIPEKERGALAGVLAFELAAALASPLGIFRCDGCHYPYTPAKRRPRSGAAHYCPSCSDGHSLAAKRAWWHTNRSRASEHTDAVPTVRRR